MFFTLRSSFLIKSAIRNESRDRTCTQSNHSTYVKTVARPTFDGGSNISVQYRCGIWSARAVQVLKEVKETREIREVRDMKEMRELKEVREVKKVKT